MLPRRIFFGESANRSANAKCKAENAYGEFRESLLAQSGFADYAAKVAGAAEKEIDELSNDDLEVLCKIWKKGQAFSSDENTTIILGVEALDDLSMAPEKAQKPLLRRIFSKKVTATDAEIENESANTNNELRKSLLLQPGFSDYAAKVAASDEKEVDELSVGELEVLYQTWTKGQSTNRDEDTIIMMGVGALAAVALAPGTAHASSIGETIATAIVEMIGPFVEELMTTAMSAIGMDISSGADKQAAAAAKSTDAQIEVIKSIHNMEAARDAAPGANECSAREAAKLTKEVEGKAAITQRNISNNDTTRAAAFIKQHDTPAGRAKAQNDYALSEIYNAGSVSVNASPAQKADAIVKSATPLDLSGKQKIGSGDVKRVEAHMLTLFGSTESRINIPTNDSNPAMRQQIVAGAEAYSTAQYARQVINKQIAENTENAQGESVMSMLRGSVDAEYNSEEFASNVQALTKPAPLLKTLVMQQALGNKIAVKQLEQTNEMAALLALQLKELVKANT